MASAANAIRCAYLTINSGQTPPVYVRLEKAFYRLGRAPGNELCFPHYGGLSRAPLVFEKRGLNWWVRDTGSVNGTFLNGVRLSDACHIGDGDVISAGHLAIRFSDAEPGVEPGSDSEHAILTTNLIDAMQFDAQAPEHWRAVLQASRELISNRPLPELFETILRLAVDAARANAAALLTYEGAELVTRARHGGGLQISTSVVDRVLQECVSVLIPDTSTDERAKGQHSIAVGHIKSVLAVPLQTDNGIIGLVYADLRGNSSFSSVDLNLLTVLANIAAIRVEQARLIEIEQERKLLARDLEQAAQIQRALLPPKPPELESLDIAAFNAPSRTVGGDYYTFLDFLDGEIGLLIADVAGKGMPAALLMASLHAMVGVIFDGADQLEQRVARLNRAVYAICPRDRFITFFIGVLHLATGRLRYCNAGHNPPLILRTSGPNETAEPTGIVLGVLPSVTYAAGSCELGPGDVLVLYSDGVTEACRPGTDDEFGEFRLASLISQQPGGAQLKLDAIRRELATFTKGTPPADDITLMIAARPLNIDNLEVEASE